MIHGIDEREQLERLHDRHKRLSLDVFDQISSNAKKEEIEKNRKELKKITLDLEALKIKLLYP